MQNFRQLVRFDVMQLFPALFQLFKCFYDRLGHSAVGLRRPAHNCELFACGNPLVAILIVEADAQ